MTAGGNVRVLKDEALFEVRPRADTPSSVEAGGATVEVVGTAFAARNADGPVTVTVAEGTVAARRQDWSATTEPPAAVAAHRIVAIAGVERTEPPQAVDIARSLARRGGGIVFEPTLFAEASAELDRLYPGGILLLGRARDATTVSGIIHADQLLPGIRAMAET
jgi:transmembrane sensor